MVLFSEEHNGAGSSSWGRSGAFFGSIIVLEPCSILLGPGSVSCVAFGRLHDSREGSGVADGEFSIELFEGEMTLASGWSAKPPTLVAIPG